MRPPGAGLDGKHFFTKTDHFVSTERHLCSKTTYFTMVLDTFSLGFEIYLHSRAKCVFSMSAKYMYFYDGNASLLIFAYHSRTKCRFPINLCQSVEKTHHSRTIRTILPTIRKTLTNSDEKTLLENPCFLDENVLYTFLYVFYVSEPIFFMFLSPGASWGSLGPPGAHFFSLF